MLKSKAARLALLAGAVGVLLAVMFYPTDEKRVRQAAESLVSGVNDGPSALTRALDQYAAADVTVSVEGLSEPLLGQVAIVDAARQASQLGPRLRVRIDAVEVRLEGKRARVNADIAASNAEVPELRRPRPSVLVFEKRGDVFRLLSAEVGAAREDQPEARP